MNAMTSNFRKSFELKIFVILGLMALMDYLFYRHGLGWTVGAFGILVTSLIVFYNPSLSKSPMGNIVIILTLGQGILQIEKTSLLSFTLMFLGIVTLAVLSQGGWGHHAGLWGRKVLSACFRIFYPLNKAFSGWKTYRTKRIPPNPLSMFVRGWFLPIIFFCLFLTLFNFANPIIAGWFSHFDIMHIIDGFSLSRTIFWVLGIMILFCVIRPKLKRAKCKTPPSEKAISTQKTGVFAWAFTKQSIMRSLVIFNLLFAFQTGMDLYYLWIVKILPKGVTYAGYAQQGAYPLIFTALLAAFFVLASENAGDKVSESKPIRILIYAWVAQNIMLVISSIYRTWLYIEMYELTYLRVAALIWMGLVAVGLGVIIARSILRQSHIWLINVNALTLLAVLYISSLMNIGGLIARYNVINSMEFSGIASNDDNKPILDRAYMKRIGSPAIPAMIQLIEKEKIDGKSHEADKTILLQMRADLSDNIDDWHRWTYSQDRLWHALESKKK
jgi:hypothetical protein